MNVRLILDGPHDGAWNMAVDEVLLESAAWGGPPTLRFYEWLRPTLSLGYFQRYEELHQRPQILQCHAVRRSSGGGAILHHWDITYSLTAPIADRIDQDLENYYQAMHQALVQSLAKVGIPAKMWESHGKKIPHDEPFLCFQRRSKRDVIVNGSKICGSAQRRRRGALLQHGSVLLARSVYAPELPGIKELTSLELKGESLRRGWLDELSRGPGWRFQQEDLMPEERRLAIEIAEARHRNEAWIRRR